MELFDVFMVKEINEEKNNIIEIKAMLRSTKTRIKVTKKKDKDYTNSPSKVGALGISQS